LLCVLGVSAVSVFEANIYRRNAEVAETYAEKTELRTIRRETKESF
jgi:hypothetical protein